MTCVQLVVSEAAWVGSAFVWYLLCSTNSYSSTHNYVPKPSKLGFMLLMTLLLTPAGKDHTWPKLKATFLDYGGTYRSRGGVFNGKEGVALL